MAATIYFFILLSRDHKKSLTQNNNFLSHNNKNVCLILISQSSARANMLMVSDLCIYMK